MPDSVVITEEALGGGNFFGRATLNSEASLNSLTIEMIQALKPKLLEWQRRPEIVFVWLEGAGEKAFCAGGDIRKLYDSICGGGFSHEDFFAAEYGLDYLIHTSPKPVVVFGHGIVMGGGLGLMAGAQFRIVTENSKLAMPEITIGLYPDVGATYFLNRMPPGIGAFLALTATRLNASDAKFAGLADFFIERARKDELFDDFRRRKWGDVHSMLTQVFTEFERRATPPPSELQRHAAEIAELIGDHSLATIAETFARPTDDPWLKMAFDTFRKGSPTSAHVIMAQLARGKHLGIREVFAREFIMSSQFARQHDLPEGIRALLIDRDHKPQWRPALLADVKPPDVDKYFCAPWSDEKTIPELKE